MLDLKVLRDDPDAVRHSQTARGEDPSLVDAALAADEQRRTAIAAYEQLRAEQKALGKQVASAQGEGKQALLARTKELSGQVKLAEAAARDAEEALSDRAASTLEHGRERRPGRWRRRLHRPRPRRGLPAISRQRVSSRVTTSTSVSCSAPSMSSAARRYPVRGSSTSTGPGALSGARAHQRCGAAGGGRWLHSDGDAGAGQASGDGGNRLPGSGRGERLPPRTGRLLPRRNVRGVAGGLPL